MGNAIGSLVGKLLSYVANVIFKAYYYTVQPFWLHLWPPLIVFYTLSKRAVLLKGNITSPTLPPASAITEEGTPPDRRTFEGSLNNPDRPTMAMTGCPFIRNTPAQAPSGSASAGPDPVVVSERILARPQGQTKTRPLVNLLGGAWIQFMIHDWFELRKNSGAPSVLLPRPDGSVVDIKPAVQDQDGSIINNHDHWWSGCQIYGPTAARNGILRSGQDGKLLLNQDGSYLALDSNGVELVGFNLNLWSGLQLLHYVFAKEHNSVCDMLKGHHPTWSDEQLFSKARLIITALIARIHTVEWTTAIVQHPAGRATQYILWYGVLGTLLGRKLLGLRKFLRRLPALIGELLAGISGGNTVMAGNNAAFAHSNEFIMVYRMHALLPDKVEVLDARTDKVIAVKDLSEIIFEKGTAVNTSVPLQDLLFSLGVSHAGALELRNYPTALRSLVTPSLRGSPGHLLDMAAVDVWRSRESRLNRFNDYLKAVALPPYRSFGRLGIDDEAARTALREVYNDDVDAIDAMVGLLAEEPLPGFIFGEAIYTIFVLQTQRRMESDRFFTQDYTEEAYTPEGIAWVEGTTMSDILTRHVPELRHWLQHDTNAFIPWKSTQKRRLHEKVLWDLLFPRQVFAWLREMGYRW